MTFTKRQEEAVRAIVGLPEDDWQPMDWATFTVAREALRDDLGRIDRVVQRRAESQRVRSDAGRSRGLRAQSPKRSAERVERDMVRDFVIKRDGETCQGAARGLPYRCGTLPGRTGWEVHEFRQRSTHPGSHLNPDDCVALCAVHHDFCTDAVGDDLELVMAVGLLVRADDAAEHAVRSTKPSRG